MGLINDNSCSINEIKKEKETTIKKRKTNTKNWANEEIKYMKNFYKKYKINKRLPKGAPELLSLKLNRSIAAISKKAFELKISDRKNKNQYKITAKKLRIKNINKTMIRNKPLIPKNTTSHIKEKPYKPEELDFPHIHPLTQEGNKLFEQMMICALGNKYPIKLNDMQHGNVGVIGDIWDGNVWRDFCHNVRINLSKIRQSLNTTKFKVHFNGRYHTIMVD